jgi:hypothetical protein
MLFQLLSQFFFLAGRCQSVINLKLISVNLCNTGK